MKYIKMLPCFVKILIVLISRPICKIVCTVKLVQTTSAVCKMSYTCTSLHAHKKKGNMHFAA